MTNQKIKLLPIIILLLTTTLSQQPVHTQSNSQTPSSNVPNPQIINTDSSQKSNIANLVGNSQNLVPHAQQNPTISNVQLKQQIVQDNSIPAQVVTPVEQIQQQQVLQIQQQSQIHQEQASQLKPWIRQQLEQAESLIQLPITQTFTFIVPSGQQVIFKWDPSKQKQLKLIVDVFYISPQGTLDVIKDAEQQQFIQVSVRNPNRVIYNTIGKVYRYKILTVDFDTDYKYIKFTNKNSQKVIIQIDVQRLQFVVLKGVKDDKLATSRNKLQSIFSQSETTQIKREHLYKWQWGYFQNEKSHQLRILGLTGIQLVVILITACTQMYYLKGLLDNRAIV